MEKSRLISASRAAFKTLKLDMQLLRLERALTSEQEAIEDRRWEVRGQYIHITAQAIDNFSDQLEADTAMLRDPEAGIRSGAGPT